jgi:hypothetical protein
VRSQSNLNTKTILVLAATFVVVLVLWNTPVVYPIKIFVVCLHELSHALAALLTGGQVESIQIFPGQGGLTTTRGGALFIILSAGYTGSVLLGGLLLYLSSFRRWGRGLMLGLSVLMLLATLAFFRNVFGVVYGLVVAAAMFVCALKLPDAINQFILRFVALASSLYAVLDIRSDLFGASSVALSNYGVVNDAVALARLTYIPALFWAVLWIVLSFAALYFFVRLSTQVRD